MKKIVITGASEGIGLETAKLLAGEGNELLLVSRNKEKLEDVIKNLPGKNHEFLVSDLTRKDDIHLVADHISAHHYDILINNAGIGMYGRFEKMPIHEQITMMNLNMIGLTFLSHSFLNQARPGDALVNIASVLGTTSSPGAAVYSATKAYVINLSEGLWRENKAKGVYVLGFCPGVTLTKFHQTSGSSEDSFPKFIVQSAADVAQELVGALNRKSKPKVVSGAVNRFMLFFHRFLSRKMVVNMMGGFSPEKTL
jgi:uncharacterized protein